MLFGPPAPADDIRFSCSLWGCEAFQEQAEVWTREHGHRLVSYEVGWMADNLLGFYRQLLSAQSPEFDVLLIDTIWPGVLSRHLVDLRPHLPASSIEQHFEPIIDNLTDGEGRLVGMPLFTDAGLLYYRKDLLDKHGFAPPETWADLERIARVILEREADPQLAGFVWQGSAYEGLTCNALEWIDSYRGGTIIDDRGEITVNNPQAQRALEMARGWIGTISPREVLAYSEIETARHFVTGRAIFMRNWMEYWKDVEARRLGGEGAGGHGAAAQGRSRRQALRHAGGYEPGCLALFRADSRGGATGRLSDRPERPNAGTPRTTHSVRPSSISMRRWVRCRSGPSCARSRMSCSTASPVHPRSRAWPIPRCRKNSIPPCSRFCPARSQPMRP
jgi:hypothetical protein